MKSDTVKELSELGLVDARGSKKNPLDQTGQSSLSGISLMIPVTFCSLLRFDGISVELVTLD